MVLAYAAAGRRQARKSKSRFLFLHCTCSRGNPEMPTKIQFPRMINHPEQSLCGAIGPVEVWPPLFNLRRGISWQVWLERPASGRATRCLRAQYFLMNTKSMLKPVQACPSLPMICCNSHHRTIVTIHQLCKKVVRWCKSSKNSKMGPL